MLLTALVHEILLSRPSVLLPGIGRFTAERHAAQIDSEQQMIRPPYKIIAFHPDTTHDDDETLALYWADLHHRSSSEVKKELDKALGKLVEMLNSKGEVFFEKLGTLKKNDDGTLIFNFLHDSRLDYPGLVAIPLPAIERPRPVVPNALSVVAAEVKTDTSTPTISVVPVQKNYVHMVMPLIALLAMILAGLTYLYTINSKPSRPAVVTVHQDQQPVKTGNYYLVTGSFERYDYAIQMRDVLLAAGYRADILEKDNTFKVVIHHFTNRDEAVAELNKIRRDKGHNFVWMYTIQ